jgi:poly(beta-D-mannuronate) lyase
MIGKHMMVVCFSIFSLAVYGKSFKANDLTQFNKAVKSLQAGDSILLSSGIWKDTQLIFKGNGTENKQICLVAEIPGKVYLEGASSLRHGNRAIVSGNWFIGNKKKNTGGIRVINEGHLIFNNFLYQLRGKELRSPLAIMNGIPNTPPSGYAQVKNVVIANNTFLDCSIPWNFCFGAGEGDQTAKPESTLLINNLNYCPEEPELIKYNDKTDGIRLENNLLISKSGLENSTESAKGAVIFKKILNMEIPMTNSAAKKLNFVTYDILGAKIEQPFIGAFHSTDDTHSFEMASAQNCGPKWYQASKKTSDSTIKQ